MRDPIKVAEEMSARNEVILQKAFELFAAGTIEDVSMNEVADAAGIGIATLYRYYGTKQQLVLAVSKARWSSFYAYLEEVRPYEKLDGYSAADRLELFLDMVIYMYKERKDLLRFTANFDTYASHRNMTEEQLEEYRGVLAPIMERFTMFGERARIDGSVRRDLTQDEIFYSIVYPMLSTATKYVNGIIWPYEKEFDGEKQLLTLKRALMDFYVQNIS